MSLFPGGAHADGALRIGAVNDLADLPTLVADRLDLFSAEGVDVTVSYGDAGRDNLRRLRAGELDLALMALTPFAIDRLADPSPGGDADPVILASLVHSTRLNHVVSRGDVREPADLRGRTVGLVKGTNAEFVWYAFATVHGIPDGAVDVVDLPPGGIASALARGDIDAAVLREPWHQRLRQSTSVDIRALPGANAYTGKWVLVSRRATVARRFDDMRAVLRAYRAAIRTIQADTAAAFALHSEQVGVDVGASDLPLFSLSLDWSVLSALQHQMQWANDAEYPVAGTGGSVLHAFVQGPLRAVAPGAVGLPEPVTVGDATP